MNIRLARVRSFLHSSFVAQHKCIAEYVQKLNSGPWAPADDLAGMQSTNLVNLPENYGTKFWLYHAMTWPQISFVAEDHKGRIVGYVLAKIEDPEEDSRIIHGHVNSISVLRSYRRLGLAKKLMLLSQEAMRSVYGASFVSLHVRRTNKAAIGLYRDSLGFEVAKVEKKYYADGEDAFSMRLSLVPKNEVDEVKVSDTTQKAP